MQLFNADAKIFLEKLKKKFCPQKVEKASQKSCILMAVGSFFFLCSPVCPKQPRTSFPFYKFSYTIICSKICDYNLFDRENFWVSWGFFFSSAKKLDVPSWKTYLPTMSYFCPIMLNLPTYLEIGYH